MENRSIKAQIQEISQKDGRFVIKALVEGNEKPYTFSFFENKKEEVDDGGYPVQTKAYKQYSANPPQVGAWINFTYRESEGEYEGKKIIYRNIMWFDEEKATVGIGNTPTGKMELRSNTEHLQAPKPLPSESLLLLRSIDKSLKVLTRDKLQIEDINIVESANEEHIRDIAKEEIPILEDDPANEIKDFNEV